MGFDDTAAEIQHLKEQVKGLSDRLTDMYRNISFMKQNTAGNTGDHPEWSEVNQALYQMETHIEEAANTMNACVLGSLENILNNLKY